jgi:hypothetical protein
VPRGGQVVGDVQQGQVPAPLEPVQQVEDLQPDGHVEHGDGLVGQQHVRLGGQGPGDGDALPLPAGQLVGELGRYLLRRGQVD